MHTSSAPFLRRARSSALRSDVCDFEPFLECDLCTHAPSPRRSSEYCKHTLTPFVPILFLCSGCDQWARHATPTAPADFSRTPGPPPPHRTRSRPAPRPPLSDPSQALVRGGDRGSGGINSANSSTLSSEERDGRRIASATSSSTSESRQSFRVQLRAATAALKDLLELGSSWGGAERS